MLAYINDFPYLCTINRTYGTGRIVEASADDATFVGDGNRANLCGVTLL